VVLAIIATAGFLPNLMEKGAIDVLLAKPLPRWKLFLGKYLGSLAFILAQATVFVVLTFVVMGVRWRMWLWEYLLVIPLVTVLFSYLYCVSALTAVMWRSTAASVLVSLGAWVAFTGVQSLHDGFEWFPEWKEGRAYAIADAARWVIPKTQDITYLAKKWTGAASTAEMLPQPPNRESRDILDIAKRIEEARMAIPAWQTIGSSLLFEAFVVGLAMWKFSRADY
jgi:hypothetical protein